MSWGSRACRESALDSAVLNHWSAIRQVVGAANARGGTGRRASIQSYHSRKLETESQNSISGIPRCAATDSARRKTVSGVSNVVFLRSHAPNIYGNRSNARRE